MALIGKTATLVKALTKCAAVVCICQTVTANSGERKEQIALQCAASSGGNAVAFMSCGGARLAHHEFVNFLNGEAFGPVNEIRKIAEILFGRNDQYDNYIVTMMSYKGGVIYAYGSGIYYSTDGKNPR